jgi:hypothetical protein
MINPKRMLGPTRGIGKKLAGDAAQEIYGPIFRFTFTRKKITSASK